MITSETPRPEPWMLFGKTPETEGWQVRGQGEEGGWEVLRGKQLNTQTQLLTRIMYDLISWAKFITVRAMISVALPLLCKASGVFGFGGVFSCDASV